MKANNHSELPNAWKKISVPTENADLPLIVIDDSVVWYGIPQAKGTFKGRGNSNYVTVCPLYFRITGKHTVNMIRSLTDIDMCVIDGIRKPIQQNKPGKTTNTVVVSGSQGIHAYIDHSRAVCPQCHSRIRAGLSKFGIYVRCSNGHFPSADEI